MDEFKVFTGGPLKIRFKGVYDWEGVYRFVHRWLLNRQFRFHERRYKDKIDTALGNEIEVNVWGEKEITEYYMYRAIVDYHLWESRDVPVIENGKQVIRTQGRIEIRINGSVITDWQKRYKADEHITHKWMEMFLNKVVFKNEIEMMHIDPFDKDLHRLEAEIKKLLKIEADASGVG